MTLPVTVVIPTRNEERHLPECLQSIQGVSSVLVVDSCSTDRTAAIAEDAGARCISFEWNGSYPKKRNWCLDNSEIATEWVLFLDADERLTPAFIAEMKRVLHSTSHVGFWVHYDNHFLGHSLKHGDTFRKLSLFRVAAGRFEHIEEDHWSSLDMEVHEHPELTGTLGKMQSRLRHEDASNMESYIARHNAYSTWEARRYLWLRSHPEAWAHLTRRQRAKYRMAETVLLGPLYFLGSYVARAGFLDGRSGLLFALLKMSYFWQIRAKIAERRLGGSL